MLASADAAAKTPVVAVVVDADAVLRWLCGGDFDVPFEAAAAAAAARPPDEFGGVERHRRSS